MTKKEENVLKEINFKNTIIYGKGWSGKSILTNMIAHWYISTWRVFSNLSLSFYSTARRDYAQYSIPINSLSDLEFIKFHPEPWLIIIDESGKNVSSRRSMSKENEEFSNLLFLWRKTNCYIVWITQRFKSIDINQRELADLIIRMEKTYRSWYSWPLFEATKERVKWSKMIYEASWIIDAIWYNNYCWLKYNTLEKSNIAKK